MDVIHPRAGVTARSLLVPLFKAKWKLLLVFALVLGGAVGIAHMMTPDYTAEAKLYVKFGREYTYRAQAGEAEVVAQTNDRGQIIKSEVEILLAKDLADTVIAKLGVAGLYPRLAQRPPAGLTPMEAARQAFLDNLKAKGGEDSNVVTVTFQHPDAKVAAAALGALIDAYMQKRRPLFTDLRAAMLGPQVAEARRAAESAESRLSAFRSANGISSFDAQRGILLQQQGALERDLQGAQDDLASAVQRVQRLRDALAVVEPSIVLYTDTYSRGPVDRAKERPGVQDSTVRQGRNPVYETLTTQLTTAESERDAASARTQTIGAQLAQVADKLRALQANEQVLGELSRDQSLAESAYRMLSQKLQEARVLDEATLRDATNVRIVQPPVVSARPKDLRPLVVLLGLLAALCATLATAFVCDILQEGFVTPEQLEKATGLPVLAAVPRHRRGRGTQCGAELATTPSSPPVKVSPASYEALSTGGVTNVRWRRANGDWRAGRHSEGVR